MLGWICRVFGHRWRYGDWEIYVFGRPQSTWMRAIVCRRCGEKCFQTTQSGFKPLDLA